MIKTLKNRIARLEGPLHESRYFFVFVTPFNTYEEALKEALETNNVTEEDVAQGRAVPFVMRITVLGELPPIDPLPGELGYDSS